MSSVLCPNCGKDTDTLDEFTGWCSNCSGVSQHRTTGGTRIAYLAANADKLEHYIAQGNSLDKAIEILADPKNGHRPNCIVCGGVIKHAPRHSVFCRKNKECRHMSRRYIYLYTKKGMTKVEALSTIMQELGVE